MLPPERRVRSKAKERRVEPGYLVSHQAEKLMRGFSRGHRGLSGRLSEAVCDRLQHV